MNQEKTLFENKDLKALENCKIVQLFMDDLIKNLKEMINQDGELKMDKSETDLLMKNLISIRCINHFGTVPGLKVTMEEFNVAFNDLWEKHFKTK